MTEAELAELDRATTKYHAMPSGIVSKLVKRVRELEDKLKDTEYKLEQMENWASLIGEMIEIKMQELEAMTNGD